jgi:hypothetical protein
MESYINLILTDVDAAIIKNANKMVKGNDEELIQVAVNQYNMSDFYTIQEIKQKEIEPEVIATNYYLLIKRRHEKRM